MRNLAETLIGLLKADKPHYNFGNDENSNQFSSTKLTVKSDATTRRTEELLYCDIHQSETVCDDLHEVNLFLFCEGR